MVRILEWTTQDLAKTHYGDKNRKPTQINFSSSQEGTINQK